MFSAFQTFGRLGAGARAVAAAWSPSALWPTGTEPGLWIDPSNLTSQWQDSTGTTPVATPGTVADSSNPVGLALDLRLGATALADPGNHLLQATSTARPLLSARRNLLTYTEDFGNAAWLLLFGLEKTPNYALAPDGSMTACRLYAPTADGVLYGHGLMNNTFTRSVWAKSNTASNYTIGLPGNLSITVTPTWTLVSGSEAGFNYLWNMPVAAGSDISIWHPQVELGLTATPYQAILTDGSAYPSTGFPIYQKYDGTDDGMATATFTAGTLSNAMDCMIAVRRDSASNAVCGLYESVSEANKVFGIAESGSGSGCVGSGAGTPTVWVDGVQLTGGTAVTRGTLHTALTVGDYHVLEFRGLDLSTWTASGFGLYSSYALNGAQGGILLFPSSTSAADRDAARAWLAAKVGVTLP